MITSTWVTYKIKIKNNNALHTLFDINETVIVICLPEIA